MIFFFLGRIMRIRTSRDGVYLFFCKILIFQEIFFLTAQGRIAQGAPILAEIRASSKAIRQQNNDELEQRTRWNEVRTENRLPRISLYLSSTMLIVKQ